MPSICQVGNLLSDVLYIYIFFSSYNLWKHVRYPSLISRQHIFGTWRRYCLSWRYPATFATGQGIKRNINMNIYIYIYIYTRSIKSRYYIRHPSSFLVCRYWLKKKRVYFRRLMLLRVYSNRFSRNHTGMVIPRVFPSCWKIFAFDQIQFDAYCAVVWRRFEADRSDFHINNDVSIGDHAFTSRVFI